MSLIIFLFSIAITVVAQIMVHSQFKKAGKIQGKSGLTGFQTAKKILDQNGLSEVKIIQSSGKLSDYYDSRNKVLALSSDVYNKSSIAAIAVAAHECGHALQDKYNYSYLTLRQSLYPLVSVTSNIAPIIIILSFLFASTGLLKIGIATFTISLFFTLITLPVEFDASKRALNVIQSQNLVLDDSEFKTAKKVLDAAALTYVAAFVTSLLELVRLIIIAKSNE
ncbi:zinc metallopeptidase [bacterium]|jgi:uncharacterized protein|nr:zinc metallopeptidase [bacterium]MBT6293517.1 zinc metallopeptidase [bacterium]